MKKVTCSPPDIADKSLITIKQLLTQITQCYVLLSKQHHIK